MSEKLYQDVSDAELAREKRHEKRRERADSRARRQRIEDLREIESYAMIDLCDNQVIAFGKLENAHV